MIGIVLGTGPSLTKQADTIRQLQRQGAKLFGCNNTFEDFKLDCWIACDPAWHEHYGQVNIPRCYHWHWDVDICHQYGYKHIKGVWKDGVSTDFSCIHFNHGSGPQMLNLAVIYKRDPILLVGHDFNDDGKRHYFDGLSDVPGEYPTPLRKYSKFNKRGNGDDMLSVYRRISEQPGLPRIVNCTPGSLLPWFEFADLQDFLKPGSDERPTTAGTP